VFAALIARLRSEIATIRNIVSLYDHIATRIYESVSPDPWEQVRTLVPSKLDLQIYNHCASVTRLYAAYATFVDELVKEYLRILPELYSAYPDLPIAILKQHRLGLSQILLKLGESGPYSHLQEVDIVATLSKGLAGQFPYTLMSDAFFVDRQNYRLDALARILGYLGLDNAATRIVNHPKVKEFVEQRFGESATLVAELKRFVDLRNDAAHTHVDDVIGLEDFLKITELVDVLCHTVAEILWCELMRRRQARGELVIIGEIMHVYGSGIIPIVKMRPCHVVVGEEIILLNGNNILGLAKICSIQDNGNEVEAIDATIDQELGLRLDRKCKPKNYVARLATSESTPQQMQLFSSENLSGREGEGAEEKAEEMEDNEANDSDGDSSSE
jgi:hypothetical protein